MKKVINLINFLAALLILSACSTEEKKPNIIIIINDDQGYQDLGCYGSPDIKTPRVDELASEGMKFTDYYVASSVCSASRAALLTGCYPQKVGVNGVFFPNTGNKGLNPKHTTIAEILKGAGYSTAAIGKWHLGDLPQFLPTNQGFDSYYGIPYSNDMYPATGMKYATDCLYREGFSHDTINEIFARTEENKQPKKVKNKVPLMRNEECIEFPCDQTTITKRYTDEGLKFIEKSVENNNPFFLYLANTMPHIPIYVSPEFEGKSERGLYGDAIEEIDYNTGRILDKLAELGIDEKTIVIFTSDNGPWLGVGKENEGSALPLFEGKFTSFEGGMRVPFVIRWPKHIPAGKTCNELASSIDLMPTLASIAGVEMAGSDIDGENIINLWKGVEGAITPHEYYFMVNRGQAVRSGDWKYHHKLTYTVTPDSLRTEDPVLFNLKLDIGESNNVIEKYPEKVEQLSKTLQEHMRDFKK